MRSHSVTRRSQRGSLPPGDPGGETWDTARLRERQRRVEVAGKTQNRAERLEDARAPTPGRLVVVWILYVR